MKQKSPAGVEMEEYQRITASNLTSEEIDSIIDGDSDLARQNLCLNKNLTETQYRRLLPKVSMEIYTSFIVRRPDFPTDMLYAEALKNPSWFLRGFMENHPNANNEIKVILALQAEKAPK